VDCIRDIQYSFLSQVTDHFHISDFDSKIINMKLEAHMCLDRSVESRALFPSEHYPPLLWKVPNLFLY
jgi:hypothetical protein